MSTTAIATAIPTGTWQLDPLHSTAGFSVKYAGVTTFRSAFTDVDATLVADDDGTTTLTGVVRAASIDVDDQQFKGHLMSPDFFEADAHPEITFTSTSLTRTDGDVRVEGDLTIKGVTQHVEGHGEVADGTEDLHGNSRLGIALETKVDRTAFGVDWNAPLPKGGFALSNTVKLTLDLAFVKA